MSVIYIINHWAFFHQLLVTIWHALNHKRVELYALKLLLQEPYNWNCTYPHGIYLYCNSFTLRKKGIKLILLTILTRYVTTGFKLIATNINLYNVNYTLYSTECFNVLVYLPIVRDFDYSKSRMHKHTESTILRQFLSFLFHKNTFPKAGKLNLTPTVPLLSEN